MPAQLSLICIFLYYCLCYKMHCWKLMNTDCQECFIQYLDLPGCLKSYWDVWIKGLLPSLQHQEIKAFNFSQIFVSFEQIGAFVAWSLRGNSAQDLKASLHQEINGHAHANPMQSVALRCVLEQMLSTVHTPWIPLLPQSAFEKFILCTESYQISVSSEQSATPTTLFKIMKETYNNHTVLREVLVLQLYLPITIWGNSTLLETDSNYMKKDCCGIFLNASEDLQDASERRSTWIKLGSCSCHILGLFNELKRKNNLFL